jgi:hypothetical protein
MTSLKGVPSICVPDTVTDFDASSTENCILTRSMHLEQEVFASQASNVTSYVLLADTEEKKPNNTTANKNFIIDP